MRVLIMTERWNSGLASIQSLGRAGHHISIFVGKSPSPHASSKYVSERVYDDGQVTADLLAQVVRDKAIDLVVPISDTDVELVAALRDSDPSNRAFIAPPTESVRIGADKSLSLKVAEDLGIRTPNTVVIDASASLRAAISRVGLPAVVKKARGIASDGMFIIERQEDIARAAAEMKPTKYLVQSFVRGDFVGVTGFALGGQLVDSFAFRTLAEFKVPGNQPYAFTEVDLAPTAILARLAKHLDWTGGIDLDFIRGADGELYFMEINPRLSGTIVLADKLGIDLPSCYVELRETGAIAARAARGHQDKMIVNVMEEAALISRDPARWMPRALEMRNRPHLNSLYLDDPAMLAQQMSAALTMAWMYSDMRERALVARARPQAATWRAPAQF